MLERDVSVETWLAGAVETEITIPVNDVTRVEIDAANLFPDITPSGPTALPGRPSPPGNTSRSISFYAQLRTLERRKVRKNLSF